MEGLLSFSEFGNCVIRIARAHITASREAERFHSPVPRSIAYQIGLCGTKKPKIFFNFASVVLFV